jgi:ribosome recycling factor
MSQLIEGSKPAFQNVLAHLEKELNNIRSGRANAAIVEEVKVEAYGSMMELKGLASISVPDAKTIQIEPWDKGVVKDIEKALIVANIGMSPNVAGTVIRLVMPPTTEENRRDTVKAVHQKGEQTRIGIRGVREEIRDQVLQDEKDKKLSEDDRFRLLEELDKLVAEFNKQIDAAVQKKEEEVMTV